MFGGYQERQEYEDELYREEEGSSDSEVDSELEFRLYSQLHYSMNHEEEQEHEQQQEQEQQREQKQEQQGPIIISSGPEVITVSDSTDEDDGICTSKVQKTRDSAKSRNRYSHPSLLPSPQGQPQSKTGEQEFVIILDSDSDSDGVENWMILGQKKLDVDCSIQLNLEGTAGSSTSEDIDDHNWSISEKDMQAQFYNRGSGIRRSSCRYYEKKNVTCRSCNKTGHLSKNCPTPKKLLACLLCGTQGHLHRSCPHQHCTNCGLPGHQFSDCQEPVYWKKHCHRCAMTGHFYDACPEIWRQYHLTTKRGPPVQPFTQDGPRSPAYCYNCSRKGHFGFECKDKRMFSGIHPTTPYVSYYDTPRDIRQRNNRMTRKAQKLQEAGFLFSPKLGNASQTKVSEEGAPPTKKQKKNQGRLRKEGKQRTPTKNTKQRQKQLQLTVKSWPEKRKERRQQKKLRKQITAQQPGDKKKDLLQKEEYFPRGPLKKVKGASMPNFKCKPNSSLFSSSREAEQKGRKWRAKIRNKQSEALRTESLYHIDEDLLLIKQRKKSKRKA